MPPQERAIVWTVFAVSFVNILDFMVVMPLGPDFAQSLGIPLSQLGWVGGSYTAAAAATGVAASFVLDSFDRKRTLVVLVSGLGLATFAASFAGGLPELIAARVGAGLFGGPAVSVGTALIADAVPVERRGRAMGFTMGAFSLATVFGVPLSLELSRLWGWQTPFMVIGGLCGLSALGAAWWLPNTQQFAPSQPVRARDLWPRLSELFALPGVWLSFALCVLVLGGVFILVPNISAYVQINLGYPRDELGLLYLCGGVASFAGMQLAGRFTDRFGSWPVYVGASSVLCGVLVMGFIQQPPLLPVVVFFTGFMIAMTGRNIPYQALLSRIPTPHLRGQFMSLNSAATHLASAVGAMLGPQLLQVRPDGGLQNVPVAAGAALASALAAPPLVWMMEQRVRGRERREQRAARAVSAGAR